MSVAIGPGERAQVAAILGAVLPPDSAVWVFGSRARPAPRRGADLDLAVEAPRPLRLDELVDLRIRFEASDLPYRVDVVDLRAVAGVFAENVLRERLPLLRTA